jgi:hypothetical protein
MRLLNKFASAESGPMEFTAVNFNGDNVIVCGRVLYLYDIRNFVNQLIEEVKRHIKDDLLFGLDIVDINWSPEVVHEEPRNTQVSYSSFDDFHNSFHQHKDTLLELILTHPSLRGRFHYVNQHNRIVWKAGPCFAYMDIAHDVEMKLFSGTQMTVGGPGRGTEVASHLIRNVSGGSIRNILILFQHFLMMGTFNKTSHLTDRDMTMVRVPLPEIGRLWILYITYIRPLIVAWQLYFSGPRAAARAKHCLFSGPHRAVDSSELSRSLSMLSQRILGIKISVSLWRHIVTWFMNHNIARFERYLTSTGPSVVAFQMGHDPKTHSLYAGDSRLPSDVDFHRFFQDMLASAVWHGLLGFPPTLLSDMKQRYSVNAEFGQKASDLVRTHVAQPTAPGIASEILTTLIPEIHRIYTQSRANDVASFLDAIGLDLRAPQSQPTVQVSHVAHPSRILALRKFLGDDRATFKHAQHALAVEFMASGNPSILLVSPTGPSYFDLKCRILKLSYP